MAAGADRDRVFRIDAVTPEVLPEAVKLPDDLAELERIIRAEDVAMLLLDPLMGTVSGKLDSHKDHDVRIALEPLARLASECTISIIGLIHVNKGQAADLLNRVMASKAFAAVARGVLYAAREDEIPTDTTFAMVGPKGALPVRSAQEQPGRPGVVDPALPHRGSLSRPRR
jgi:hypothetical protein